VLFRPRGTHKRYYLLERWSFDNKPMSIWRKPKRKSVSRPLVYIYILYGVLYYMLYYYEGVWRLYRGLKDLMTRGDNIKVIGRNDIKYSRLFAKIDILSLLFIIMTSYCCTICTVHNKCFTFKRIRSKTKYLTVCAHTLYDCNVVYYYKWIVTSLILLILLLRRRSLHNSNSEISLDWS